MKPTIKVLRVLTALILTFALLPFAPVPVRAADPMPAGFMVTPAAVDFGTAVVGYAQPAAQVVSASMSSLSLNSVYDMDAEITGANAHDFEFSLLSARGTILYPGDPPFEVSVQPKSGLAAGVYTANVTFTGDDMSIPTTCIHNVPVTFTIINASAPPQITTSSLPDGTVGAAYSISLAATGDGPIVWSLESGSLPPGLALSGDTISVSVILPINPNLSI